MELQSVSCARGQRGIQNYFTERPGALEVWSPKWVEAGSGEVPLRLNF